MSTKKRLKKASAEEDRVRKAVKDAHRLLRSVNVQCGLVVVEDPRLSDGGAAMTIGKNRATGRLRRCLDVLFS